MASEQLTIELHRRGWGRQATFTAWADPDDGAALQRVLRDAVERERHAQELADFTLEVRPARGRRFTVVAS